MLRLLSIVASELLKLGSVSALSLGSSKHADNDSPIAARLRACRIVHFRFPTSGINCSPKLGYKAGQHDMSKQAIGLAALDHLAVHLIAFGLNRGARVRGRPKRPLVTIGRTTQAPYLPGETVPLGEGRRPASCCACGVRRRDFDADASATCGTAGSVHVPARGAVLAQRWKESLPAISLLSPVPKPSTH